MIGLRLCIVSYAAALDARIEETVLRMAPGLGPGFVIERCQRPHEVIYLTRLWARRGREVQRLDLIGHGTGGRFQLGDGLLFASDGTGYGLAKTLGEHLAPSAELRLLGCNTATEARIATTAGVHTSGRALLSTLSTLLGAQRRAIGTTAPLMARHFGPGGLTPAAEALLVDATQAPAASSLPPVQPRGEE